jgi:hypothetical protein
MGVMSTRVDLDGGAGPYPEFAYADDLRLQ